LTKFVVFEDNSAEYRCSLVAAGALTGWLAQAKTAMACSATAPRSTQPLARTLTVTAGRARDARGRSRRAALRSFFLGELGSGFSVATARDRTSAAQRGLALEICSPLRGCRSAGKALAFAVFDQLVICQALLVNGGAFLVQLSLSSLALCLIPGNPRAPFGCFGMLLADTGLLSMILSDSFAALLQFALTSPDAHPG